MEKETTKSELWEMSKKMGLDEIVKSKSSGRFSSVTGRESEYQYKELKGLEFFHVYHCLILSHISDAKNGNKQSLENGYTAKKIADFARRFHKDLSDEDVYDALYLMYRVGAVTILLEPNAHELTFSPSQVLIIAEYFSKPPQNKA